MSYCELGVGVWVGGWVGGRREDVLGAVGVGGEEAEETLLRHIEVTAHVQGLEVGGVLFGWVGGWVGGWVDRGGRRGGLNELL